MCAAETYTILIVFGYPYNNIKILFDNNVLFYKFLQLLL